MMPDSGDPAAQELVLIGGGHSHVEVLRRFGLEPPAGAHLTLICRAAHTPYSGMLPGLVAGHYDFDDAHIDLRPLARFAGARFIEAEVAGLDTANRRVLCDGHPPVPYDLLSINTGATPRTGDVPGASEFAVPVKPINRFLAGWHALLERAGAHRGGLRIAVVGAGAAGVEILLAIQYRLARLRAEAGPGAGDCAFHLFSATPDILPGHNGRVRRAFRQVLARRRVVVHLAAPVARVAPGRLWTAAGDEIEADEILWVTAAGAPAWPGVAGLAVDADGFIRVCDGLQSVSHPEIFAAGDIASLANDPRPKAGVIAVRQGPPLADNLRRAIRRESPRPWHPQKRFLSLISTGDRYAIASRGAFFARGRLVWLWKDWIDRRFMRRYQKLAPRG